MSGFQSDISQTRLSPVVRVEGAGHCAVCGEIAQNKVVSCDRCETLYHADCFEYNDGCAIYGCKSTRPAATNPALPEPPPVRHHPVLAEAGSGRNLLQGLAVALAMGCFLVGAVVSLQPERNVTPNTANPWSPPAHYSRVEVQRGSSQDTDDSQRDAFWGGHRGARGPDSRR